MNVNVELERNVCRRQLGMLDRIEQDAINLNQGLDRHAFIQTSHQTFSLPKKFKFQQHKGDIVSSLIYVVIGGYILTANEIDLWCLFYDVNLTVSYVVQL